MPLTLNIWVRINLYKKYCLPFIIGNKKNSLKQVVSGLFLDINIYILKEKFYNQFYNIHIYVVVYPETKKHKYKI